MQLFRAIGYGFGYALWGLLVLLFVAGWVGVAVALAERLHWL